MDPKYVREWGPQHITTDNVIWTRLLGEIHILMVVRKANLLELALPGGFLETDETIRECAIRELAEETGVMLSDVKGYKELFYEDRPDRDPRARMVTHVFAGYVPPQDLKDTIDDVLKASSLDPEVAHVTLVPLNTLHLYKTRADHHYLIWKAIDILKDEGGFVF